MSENQLQTQLDELCQKHREMDLEIEQLSKLNTSDDLHIHRLKRARLTLKDQIAIIRSSLIPDIIA